MLNIQVHLIYSVLTMAPKKETTKVAKKTGRGMKKFPSEVSVKCFYCSKFVKQKKNLKRHIQSVHRNKLVRAADCNIISELFERQNTSAANENIDVSIQEEDYNNNSNENINVSIQEEDNNNNNTNIPEKSIQNTQYPVSDFQNILESVLDGKLKQHAITIMDLIKTQLTNQGGSDSKKLQQPTNTPHLNVVNPTNIQNTVRHSKSFNEINSSSKHLHLKIRNYHSGLNLHV